MTDVLTPPPVPVPAPAPTPPRRSSAAARVVAILVIAFGIVLVAGAVLSTAGGAIAAALVHSSDRSLAAGAVRALDLEVSAGNLAVEFSDDVDEAVLSVRGSRDAADWTLRTEGQTLVVASPDWRFGTAWFLGGAGSAVLTLPSALEGVTLDTTAHVGAGDLSLSGRFGDLGVTVGAGSLDLEGSAPSLTLDVSAGSAAVDLADVRTANMTLSAGSVDGRFTGTQPDDIVLDVSAGDIDLTVPAGAWDVNTDVSAGDVDNRITTRSGTPSRIDVRVSAGSVTLRDQ